MKVYVVTSGEYSGYGIEAVFLNKEKAEIYCACHNKEDEWVWYQIEEYDSMDDNIESTDEEIVYRYYVWGVEHKRPYYNGPTIMYSSEVEADRARHKRDDKAYDLRGQVQFPRSQQFVYLNRPAVGDAIKIVQDRYAKWKAEKEGLA